MEFRKMHHANNEKRETKHYRKKHKYQTKKKSERFEKKKPKSRDERKNWKNIFQENKETIL